MTIALDIFKDRKVAVMGLGRSGLASARALKAGGAQVICWDDREIGRNAAADEGFAVADLSGEGAMAGIDALILSPGIPHTHPSPNPVAAAAKAAGVPILGDVELLARQQAEARFMGITGTNGKSTTTALCGHILSELGHRAEVGGNLGTPALSLEPLGAEGTYVLEMSSYQLELTPSPIFDVAVLLNIGNDHLERHGGLQGYIDAKRHIFEPKDGTEGKPGNGDAGWAVISIDDMVCRQIALELERGPRRVIPISGEGAVEGGIYVEDGHLVDDMDGHAYVMLDMDLSRALPGSHNAQNAAGAYAAARAVGVDPTAAASAIASFPGLPHRQQMAALADGVTYINDSKATNAEAASKALRCYEAIHWIAGGQSKGSGYGALDDVLGRIRHAYLIGEAAEEIAEYLGPRVPHTICGDLKTAIERATALAREEGGARTTVLLSPACASFDQFKDFEERGDAFCRMVAALPARERRIFADGENNGEREGA